MASGTRCMAPIQLEKGHWVEVQPRHDPADDLSAGVKAYVLPLPADDVDLDELQRRGWLSVHGGAVGSTVVTLTSPPQLEEMRAARLGHPRRRGDVAGGERDEQRAEAGRRSIAPVESHAGHAAAACRPDGDRGHSPRLWVSSLRIRRWPESSEVSGAALAAWPTSWVTMSASYYVSAERHRLLLANMVTVAESARRAQSEQGQVRKLTATLALLFQQVPSSPHSHRGVGASVANAAISRSAYTRFRLCRPFNRDCRSSCATGSLDGLCTPVSTVLKSST